MTVLISPEGREYRTSNLLEERRLVTGHRYRVVSENDVVFRPGDYNVATVNQYLRDNPEDAERVLEEERNGQNRSTIDGI